MSLWRHGGALALGVAPVLLACCHWLYPFSAGDAAADMRSADERGARDLGRDAGAADKSRDARPATTFWSKRFGGSLDEFAAAVDLDAAGNIFVGGAHHGSTSFGGATLNGFGKSDIFLASYDSSGAHRFSRSLGGPESDSVHGLAVSGVAVHLAGGCQGLADFGGGAPLVCGAYGNAFVAIYSSGSGGHVWSQRYGESARARGVAVDAQGHILVAGDFELSIDFGGGVLPAGSESDVFLASVAPSSQVFAKKLTASEGIFAGGVAVDAGGNSYVSGYFWGTMSTDTNLTSKGDYDVLLASYSAIGAFRWARSFGGVSWDQGPAVAVDGAGHVYLVGHFWGNADIAQPVASKGKNDAFLVAFAADGTHLFTKTLGGADDDRALAVAVDAGNNVYVAGRFSGTTALGETPVSSKGLDDIFLVSFTSSGALRFARTYGGAGEDVVAGVAVDAGGSIYLAGSFNAPLDFGFGALVSGGGYDVFLVKLPPQ